MTNAKWGPMTRTTALLLILGVAGCNVGGATSKPDLSGTWVLDLSRSTLDIVPPDSTIFVIDHSEPFLTAKRTHILDGVVNVVDTRFTTDSALTAVEVSGLEIPTRVHWDGDVLILEQEWSRGGVLITNLVRYTLEDEGRTLVADEYMQAGPDGHHNVWVFRRR
jgi:hypothetical protein